MFYEDLWPGIDLVYQGTARELKHTFVVAPGADPAQIRLAYRGAEVRINAEGQLEVSTPAGSFYDDKPYVYQEVDGERVEVESAYVLVGAGQRLVSGRGVDLPRHPEPPDHRAQVYGFQLGEYDPDLPLLIDPTMIVYAGYIGGSSGDSGNSIAVDSEGNAYITGSTTSSEVAGFPVTVGPDLMYNTNEDAFVVKVEADGSGLVYAGYIGGSGTDDGQGIAVDGSGSAYVTGSTSSSDFPTEGNLDPTFNGIRDAFVAKVEADGSALVYAGYIGGSDVDVGRDIAVDSDGAAYITGSTGSNQGSFPVTVGPDQTFNDNEEAFVAKVEADGSALVYAGYIGGSGDDDGIGIAVDSGGNAYVTGFTGSSEASFPVKVGPDLTHEGGFDAFVAKVKADGTELVYAGYIGGSDFDQGASIAVDSDGNAYVTGVTQSSGGGFPVTVGPDATFNGIQDAFVAKVKADGTGLVYSGFIGGSDSDTGLGIAVDGNGNAYVTGFTDSSEASFPVKVGPDLTHEGGFDAFVAKVRADGTDLDYAGYIGGSSPDQGLGIAVDSGGNAYVAGFTQSSQAGFPVTVGPDLTLGDVNGDAFVAKIELPTPGSFSENFNDETLPATLENSTGTVATFSAVTSECTGSANGAATFPGATDSNRSYLRTTKTDFHAAGFVAEVTVSIPAGDSPQLAFFGLGAGVPDPSNSFEPAVDPHIYSNASPDGFDDPGFFNTNDSDSGPIAPILSAAGDGCHRLRLEWNVETAELTASIHQNYSGGDFLATTVLADVNGEDNGFDDTNSRIFFGGAGGIVFDDLVVLLADNPTPTISSISPDTATAGSPGFTLSVDGTGFVISSTVEWNGTPLITSFVSDTQLTATVPASLLVTAGAPSVTVVNPTPGGGTSNPAIFTITEVPVGPVLTITKTHAGNFTQGETGAIYTVTVTNSGSGATDGTTVTVTDPMPSGLTATAASGTGWDCTGTTFPTTGTVTCTRSDVLASLAAYPTLTITVDVSPTASSPITNTASVVGGGDNTSADGQDVSTVDATPAITHLSPPSVTAGGATFDLTVTGTGYVPTSDVHWNGGGVPTTFHGPTELTAEVDVPLIAVAGAAVVTVVTPAGTSNPAVLLIAPPPEGPSPMTFDFGPGSHTLTTGEPALFAEAAEPVKFDVNECPLTATVEGLDMSAVSYTNVNLCCTAADPWLGKGAFGGLEIMQSDVAVGMSFLSAIGGFGSLGSGYWDAQSTLFTHDSCTNTVGDPSLPSSYCNVGDGFGYRRWLSQGFSTPGGCCEVDFLYNAENASVTTGGVTPDQVDLKIMVTPVDPLTFCSGVSPCYIVERLSRLQHSSSWELDGLRLPGSGFSVASWAQTRVSASGGTEDLEFAGLYAAAPEPGEGPRRNLGAWQRLGVPAMPFTTFGGSGLGFANVSVFLQNGFDSGNPVQTVSWDHLVVAGCPVPEQGSANGNGSFVPESGSAVGLTLNGSEATFRFQAKRQNGENSGQLDFRYRRDNLRFRSADYNFVTVSGTQVIVEGTGTINRTGSFKFRLHGFDRDPAGGVDRVAIRIWEGGFTSFELPTFRAEGNLSGGGISVGGSEGGGGEPPDGAACDNDSVCEPGEDCNNCPNDCAGVSRGRPSGRFCCGDGTLQPLEGDGICNGNI